MDCHFLLQGIFPTQGSNPGLPHCRRTLYRLGHQFCRVAQRPHSGFSVKILQEKRTNSRPNHCYAPLRTQGPSSVYWLPPGLSPTKAAHSCLPSPRNLPHVSARKAADRQELFHFMVKKKMPSISCCKMVKKQSMETWFPELPVL